MFEMVKAFRDALGIDATWSFVAIVMLIGALFAGSVAWIVDRAYKNTMARLEPPPVEEPLIPPRSAVAFPPMPFPIVPLTDEQRTEILERIATAPSPPLRIEIEGYGFNPYPKEKNEAVQQAIPGVGELLAPLSFPIHILNTSRERRVSLRFRSFEIAPGLFIGGVQAEGIQPNLGPEESTEGRITVLLEPREYARLTKGTHLKIWPCPS